MEFNTILKAYLRHIAYPTTVGNWENDAKTFTKYLIQHDLYPVEPISVKVTVQDGKISEKVELLYQLNHMVKEIDDPIEIRPTLVLDDTLHCYEKSTLANGFESMIISAKQEASKRQIELSGDFYFCLQTIMDEGWQELFAVIKEDK